MELHLNSKWGMDCSASPSRHRYLLRQALLKKMQSSFSNQSVSHTRGLGGFAVASQGKFVGLDVEPLARAVSWPVVQRISSAGEVKAARCTHNKPLFSWLAKEASFKCLYQTLNECEPVQALHLQKLGLQHLHSQKLGLQLLQSQKPQSQALQVLSQVRVANWQPACAVPYTILQQAKLKQVYLNSKPLCIKALWFFNSTCQGVEANLMAQGFVAFVQKPTAQGCATRGGVQGDAVQGHALALCWVVQKAATTM